MSVRKLILTLLPVLLVIQCVAYASGEGATSRIRQFDTSKILRDVIGGKIQIEEAKLKLYKLADDDDPIIGSSAMVAYIGVLEFEGRNKEISSVFPVSKVKTLLNQGMLNDQYLFLADDAVEMALYSKLYSPKEFIDLAKEIKLEPAKARAYQIVAESDIDNMTRYRVLLESIQSPFISTSEFSAYFLATHELNDAQKRELGDVIVRCITNRELHYFYGHAGLITALAKIDGEVERNKEKLSSLAKNISATGVKLYRVSAIESAFREAGLNVEDKNSLGKSRSP